MKKRKRLWLAASLCIVLCLAWWLYSARSHSREERGLFSWSAAQLAGEGRQALFALMAQQQIGTLYQSIPSDADAAQVRAFLEAAADQGLSVWLLTGDPNWALDPAGTAMTDRVERAAEYQMGLPEEARFRGVMMDCEPYLTDRWANDPEGVMDSWCAAMAAARQAAHEEGLLFAVCIPYYLDTEGFSAHLERLVQTGCDGLAIMNYHKKNEAAHIAAEVALASAAGVPVTVIYELQPPGTHGLTENNTYHNDGLAAVEESWAALCRQFGSQGLSIAFHEFHSLQEMTGHE